MTNSSLSREKKLGIIWKDSYYVAGLTHGKYGLSNGKSSQTDSVSYISEGDLVSQIQSYRGR